jgi:hypothetical protein
MLTKECIYSKFEVMFSALMNRTNSQIRNKTQLVIDHDQSSKEIISDFNESSSEGQNVSPVTDSLYSQLKININDNINRCYGDNLSPTKNLKSSLQLIYDVPTTDELTFDQWEERILKRLNKSDEENSSDYLNFEEDYDYYGFNGLPVRKDPIKIDNDLLYKEKADLSTYEVQSFDIITKNLKNLKNLLPTNIGLHGDYLLSLAEDLSISLYSASLRKNKTEAIIDLVTFYKLRTKKSLLQSSTFENITNKVNQTFGLCVQSDDNPFSIFREYLEDAKNIAETSIFKKLKTLLLYCLSLSLFEEFGITFDNLGYSMMEKEALKKKYSSKMSFTYVIADTILFLMEKGTEIMLTGSIEPIYHSGKAYTKWYKDVQEVKRMNTLSFDPETHGFSEAEFIALLESTIEQGESIHKYSSNMSNFDKKQTKFVLDDIKMIKAMYLTKTKAREQRQPPFSLLIYGDSGIGKSSILSMLFNHFGKINNLPLGSEFCYTRNAVAKFWDGFTTSQWCVVMDDVAFMNVNKASNGDPSCMEFIQVINAIPFVPDQAALEDKGKTPLRCKLALATTNTEDLNAHYYFAHPSAAQRRFPYIIEPFVKEEYKTNGMLDSSKVPEQTGYPDLWLWTIKKVSPVSTRSNARKAVIEIIHDKVSLKEFLKWFNEAVKKFQSNQATVSESLQKIQDTNLCSTCELPDEQCDCVQALDIYSNTFSYLINILTMYMVNLVSTLTIQYWWARYLMDKFSYWADYIPNKIRRKYNQVFESEYWNSLGDRTRLYIGTPSFFIHLSIVISTCLISYKLYKSCKDDLIEQTVSQGKAPEQTDNEKENVWINDQYELSTFDVGRSSLSSNGMTEADFTKIIERNIIYIQCESGPDTERVSRAICLSGQYYLLNNHSVPNLEKMNVRITSQSRKDGITENTEMIIDSSNIFRFPDKDLCILHLSSLPPKKSIVNYIVSKTFAARLNGFYLTRNPLGDIERNEVVKMSLMKETYVAKTKSSNKLWYGLVDKITTGGYCGTPLIGKSELGYCILGLHFLANPSGNDIRAAAINREFVEEFLNNRIVIQSGEPELSSETAERKLGDLHYKSCFRYLTAGTAAVYGSFKGFRTKNKSRVELTPLAPELSKSNYKIKYGKPEMKGWEPWNIAATDLVQPVTKVRCSILDKCKNSFLENIVSKLSKDELSLFEVYDYFTVVNGAPGVAYIDKVKRQTSAGNPWKKSKQYFLESIAPQRGVDDPVEFTPEIMNRVHQMEETYAKGERCMANFCAHLKDEAVSFKKMKMKKTRVFTGAPVDYTLVVRKFFLSSVRVIQRNKFIFEAAPGTNAQSTEWGEIYEYLTKFGTDRIVAGDYKSFDKRMPPQFIMAAFEILIELSKMSGNFTEDDVKIMYAIAYDTAFPVVDYNGDLVQFYGSNPSGHPLTVIINSLVNSLYMRYCYYLLNPSEECVSFQDNVSLMTYGDDNIMGVSINTPWFNHTAISQSLSTMDITYTMADKEAESVPFINISEASFLKRTWRWDDEVKAYCAPLDHDSIEKMLMVWVRSKTISKEEQCVAVISSALREYFFYGKEIFDQKRILLSNLIRKCELERWQEEWVLPTWPHLVDQFWKNSQQC